MFFPPPNVEVSYADPRAAFAGTIGEAWIAVVS
jgi:hypothetical protein